MANRRMIASDIFEDEFIGSLSFFERLLWIGLFCAVVDDQGRSFDAPALIRSRVFLFDTTITDDKVEQALVKLAKAGKVMRYTANGKKMLQIAKWWIYQTPSWASPSKFPPPNNWVDRAKYHAAGNKIVMLNWELQGGLSSGLPSELPSEQDRAIKERKGEDVKGEVKEETTTGDCGSFDLDFAELSREYEKNIGTLSSSISDMLDDDLKEYGKTICIDAITEAVRQNKRKWSYVQGIMKNWKVDGRQEPGSNGRRQKEHSYRDEGWIPGAQGIEV